MDNIRLESQRVLRNKTSRASTPSGARAPVRRLERRKLRQPGRQQTAPVGHLRPIHDAANGRRPAAETSDIRCPTHGATATTGSAHEPAGSRGSVNSAATGAAPAYAASSHAGAARDHGRMGFT